MMRTALLPKLLPIPEKKRPEDMQTSTTTIQNSAVETETKPMENQTRTRSAAASRSSLSAILVVLVALAWPWPAHGQITNGVFVPGSTNYGKSYPEWCIAWQQWFDSLETIHHPFLDTADLSVGQSGPVWFLARIGGGG